jgi:2-oxoisovalerate dehydrogenase E1 component alpha subunit
MGDYGEGFHVPTPKARPGDEPDFSNVKIPPAGAAPRPDAQTPEPQMRELAFALVRVLDEKGKAVGPWAPDIPAETLLKGLRAMEITRALDDRLFRAHRQGKTSFYMKSTGEEAIAVAQSLLLGADDMCFPTYRVAGWLVARDYPLLDMVNQVFSNAEDPLKGRQLPVLYSARDYGFYSLSGNLAVRVAQAVGWAMAVAYRGDDRMTLAYCGEGSTAEGDFHEALTFAAVYRPQVMIAVTNNQWAISSFSGIAGGENTTFAAKGHGYGLPGLRVDGNDFLAVWAATQWASERARAGLGCTVIEFFTYRAAGHSTSDDPTRYRPKAEPSEWPLGDPIERLKTHLIVRKLWSEERHRQMIAEIHDTVRDAVKAGEKIGTLGQSKPALGLMFDDVFKEPDWRQLEQRKELGV